MSDKYPGGLIQVGAPAGFSVAFPAATSKLSIASMTALGSDFTIECWIYPTSFADYNTIFDNRTSDADASGCVLGLTAANKAYFYTNSVFQITTTTALVANKWTHLALVRSGSGSGNVKIYINGVADATTATYTTSFSRTAASIGDDWNTRSNLQFFGYISNFRTLTTALYTTTFTPPTQLFPITNTTLLTCQSPTIIDTSGNSVAITIAGTATAVASNFTPFPAYTGFNPALGAAAGGVWTLDQAEYYQANRQWPIYDPYFKQTTLMLHGNGTNNAQNNTFLDSSTNNFTITRNGNTTQGTFTPFSQTGWSYYGTTGSYCQLNNADYAIGTGDFTVEFWMYCTDDSGSRAFAGLPGAAVLTISMTSGSSGARQPYMEFGGAGTLFTAFSGYLNRWTHVAFVRSSGTITVYQNGVALSSASKAASFPNCANLYLARVPTDTTQDFIGYFSNYRITKSAVYTSNFTPSTQPLTVLPNTVLLTFQDNRFRDNSANNSTVTPAGTASVQAFSPFVPAYITPTTYSYYFSGSASYLSGASNAALVFGTGMYTIEMWIYQTARSGTQYLLGGGGGFQLAINSTGFIFGGVAGVGDFTAATVAASLNTWTHIALVRNSTSAGGVAYYVNGVAAGTATDATNYTTNVTLNIATTNGNTGVTPFSGCLSNLRVLKGTALYTAAFTPPTAPLTAITNTSLLTCQSSTFVDNSTNALALTQTGTTYPVASPTPFNPKVDQTTLNSAYSTSLIGGSAYFDGSGDFLNYPVVSLGSSNVTVEFFVYLNSVSGTQELFGINYNADLSSYGALRIQMSGGTMQYMGSTSGSSFAFGPTSTSASPTVGQWAHVALVRNSTTVTCYLNGVSVGAATGISGALYTGTYGGRIGNVYYSGGNAYLNGYISGFRVLVGTALYTSNFAPPIAPPTPVTNTQLLLNYTNAGIIDNTAKNVFETVGDAQISTTQSKYGGSSMKFDGTGDWLVARSTVGDFLQLGGTSRPFTIEAWTYPTSFATNVTIAERGGGNANWTSTTGIQYTWFFKNADSKMYWQFYAGGTSVNSMSSSVTISLNTWTHVAVSYDGTTTYLFVNGVQVGTSTSSYTLPSAPNQMRVGAETDGSNPFFGYIDDLRITQGVARYTTNFTPPTSQLQDQ